MTLARVRMSVRMRACPRHRALRAPQRLWVKWLILRSTTGLASKGLDHGPHTIAWHMENHHLTVSPASISRHLSHAGYITPAPQKRPKSSYIRFAAEQPNER